MTSSGRTVFETEFFSSKLGFLIAPIICTIAPAGRQVYRKRSYPSPKPQMRINRPNREGSTERIATAIFFSSYCGFCRLGRADSSKNTHENEPPCQPHRVQNSMDIAKPNSFKTSPIPIDYQTPTPLLIPDNPFSMNLPPMFRQSYLSINV